MGTRHGKRFAWAPVRLARLWEMVTAGRWAWCADPRRRGMFVMAPNRRVFQVRLRPRVEIREVWSGVPEEGAL